MSTEKFIRNKTALITLIAACLVVLISLGVRQTFGLFFMDFKNDLGISLTEAGLSIGIQMLMWGLTGPCLLYTSPSPRDATLSRMPSSA